MLLMQTDFPEPVEPAISRCGIDLRSATIGLPLISLPTAKVILDLLSRNSCESMTSLICTIVTVSFSTSMPTAALARYRRLDPDALGLEV